MKPIMARLVLHLCFLLGLALVAISGCSTGEKTGSTEDRSSSEIFEEYVSDCTLEDVVGEHNPRFIGIWGGKLTSEPWFIRFATVSWRFMNLRTGLEYYFAVHNEYPRSWEQFAESTFYPIRPLDPVTSEPLRYDCQPRSNDDFTNIGIEASPAQWRIAYQAPSMPDGEWVHLEIEIDPFERHDEAYYEDIRSSWPTAASVTGAVLAESLDTVLWHYVHRRNEIPSNADDLLDGLYSAEPWAASRTGLILSHPGTFVFGVDRDRGWAAAIWRDEAGQVYSKLHDYSPWPEDGWDHVPTWPEIAYLQADASYSNPYTEGVGDFDPSTYVPPTVLWTCSLPVDLETISQ